LTPESRLAGGYTRRVSFLPGDAVLSSVLSLSALLIGCGGVLLEDGKDPGVTDTGPGTDVTDTGSPITDTEDTQPPDPSTIDDDEDGYTADEDCDDDDPEVNPGADETVNGVDDDCNDLVDDFDLCHDGSTDWSTIQEGIDTVDEGGLLVICPGTYTENLVIQNKDVGLLGRDGADVTIVDGSTADVVLRVARSDASVSGLTLQNGTNTEGTGGVMTCNNADLTVSESILATGDAVDGGLFYSTGCTLDFSTSTLRGGTATGAGGGAYLNQTDGTFAGNEVVGNVAYEGGGVFVNQGNVAIDGNTVSGNQALAEGEEEYSGRGSGGGGLFIYGDNTVSNNIIATNDSTHNGGGIYILYGSGDIVGNEISGNTCSEDGAGVYTNQASNWISGNLVSGNVAVDDAGGIRIYRGTAVIEDNTFEANEASDDGGGLKMSHSTNTLRRNDFIGNITGDAGGGVELDNDTTDVSDNYFEGNQALRGAGLHSWWNEGNIHMEDLTFVENVASDCGGGMSLDNDRHTVTLEHMLFEGNQAMDGAAVCVDEVPFDDDDDEETDMITYETDVEITNSLFLSNAAGDDGGAIYIKTASRAVIEHVTIWGNSGGEGGAMALKLSTVTARNNILAQNSGGEQVLVEESDVGWMYNDVWGSDPPFDGMDDPTGTSGNISEDPDFVDAGGGDLNLDAGSPCVDAGTPGGTDPDGSRSDMGAFGGDGGGW